MAQLTQNYLTLSARLHRQAALVTPPAGRWRKADLRTMVCMLLFCSSPIDRAIVGWHLLHGESLERLSKRLGITPSQAGERYESIRQRMVNAMRTGASDRRLAEWDKRDRKAIRRHYRCACGARNFIGPDDPKLCGECAAPLSKGSKR